VIRLFAIAPIMLMLLPGALGAGSVAAQAAADPLDALELRVTADPDDLRAGNDYRMTVIRAQAYDRALAFFKELTARHPDSANAHLNYGFAYVDKIPAAGAISQVILANSALTEFSRSLELHPSWIAYYTRGVSYLYWPKIFDRTRLGVADLEIALTMQRAADRRHAYHVRTFLALGDGYWLMDQPAKARAAWRAGLKEFPQSAALKQRLASKPPALHDLLRDVYDPSRRVDSDLTELWTS
jgi:tetratricopeptide (TPR) repeat protein